MGFEKFSENIHNEIVEIDKFMEVPRTEDEVEKFMNNLKYKEN
jgi:hypothetical protein